MASYAAGTTRRRRRRARLGAVREETSGFAAPLNERASEEPGPSGLPEGRI